MQINCTYTYKGKQFSTDRIKRLLVEEMPNQDQESNIRFLQEYLGMSREEVIIVAGLIDNKSLGRFKADGKILLSEKADIRTARHEAFHRVWRMFLTPAERADAIRQFKYKPDWKSTIENYKINYPNLTDEDLIEEFFADEFETYQLQPDSYKVQPNKSLFERLLNFIKKVLGLKLDDIKTIYDRILSKEFTGSPKIPYSKDADSIVIGESNREISVTDKNDIVNFLSARIIGRLVNKDLEGYTDVLEDLKWDAHGQLEQYVDTDLLNDIGDNLDSDGIVWQEIISKLEYYGLEIVQKKRKIVKEDQTAEDVETESILGETSATREFVSAIKVNPKDGLSTRVKLLLASFQHPVNKTSVGVPVTVSASTAYNQIALGMAGIPTKYFLEELEKLDLPFVEDLLTKLGKTPEGWNTKTIKLRNEFVSKMALTENNFTFFQYGEDDKKNTEIRFSNLNSETREANLIRKWNSNLLAKTDFIIEDQQVQYLKYFRDNLNKITSRDVKTVARQMADVFGIVLDERTIDKSYPHLRAAATAILGKPKYKENGRSIYAKFDIGGQINKIAKIQAKYEESVDTMITVLDTKIYALGLNTQQTIMVNKAKYLVNRFKKESQSTQDILNRLRKEMPEMFNNWNMSKDELGNWRLQPLLAAIYDNNFDITIPYAAKNSQEDEMYVDKMSEPDLIALHINGAMTGNFMSMKHSDRSTFFAYKTDPLVNITDMFGNSSDIKTPGINIIVEGLVKEIQKEVEFARSEYSNLPMQYIGNKDGLKTGYSKLLSETRLTEILNGKEINESDKTQLYKMVEDDFKKFMDTIKENELYVPGVHIAGINPSTIAEFNKRTLPFTGETKGFKNSAIELTLLYSYVNEHLFHMNESRLFTGDNRMFKNANDLYKRLATQSSNGLLTATDDLTNSVIRQELNQSYEVFDIATGKTVTINASDNLNDTKVRGVTIKEQDDYKSRLLVPSGVQSKLGIENPTKIASAMEWGFLQDIPNPTESEKSKMISKIEQAEKKYSEVNENDGLSYMTLPAFKNYQIRLGNWTDEMDVAYQVEMELLKYRSLSEAKDLVVTIKGKNKYNGLIIKPFEGAFNKGKDENGVPYKLEAMHTLKVQYAGPSVQEAFAKGREELEYSFFTVFKTSNHLLQPSAIMGTNLQAMNHSMLVSGVQVAHMGSANKVGAVDPKIAAKQVQQDENDTRKDNPIVGKIADKGLTFYDENGAFNQDAFLLASNPETGFANYLFDWEYYKDQVKIGNKEKSEISGSTQSLKILLSNLIVNGQERFPGAMDIVKRYLEIIDQMVKANQDSFLTELGWDGDFTSYEKLKEVVLNSSQVANAADNLKNLVENFLNDPKNIETLSLRQKIENVLHALVTSNVIDFDRAGNSYPQAASTGYEPYGSRIRLEDGTYQSQELDFYEPVFDNDGNLIKVKPAEVILPLPSKWIPSLYKAAGTNNLIEALEWLNNKVAEDKKSDGDLFIVKGLRIPNQQLSSNDMFRVKKFTLPTVQAYAIVPSEIVIKVGSDFDIDKINIYWTSDIQNRIFSPEKVTTVNLDNQLLSIEKEILLHPNNVQHLLMPLTNDIFVETLYKRFFVKSGLIEGENDNFFTILNPITNAKKAVIFVQGKFAVGIGALSITFAAVNQVNSVAGNSINSEYYVGQDKEGNPVFLPSAVRFGSASQYDFSSYTDNQFNTLSEVMSQLLTMYVDGVKEPYAVLMNITLQTANVVDYLIKNNVSAAEITKFLSQPIIKKYLTMQKVNESMYLKNDTYEKDIPVYDKDKKPVLDKNGQPKYKTIVLTREETDKKEFIKKILETVGKASMLDYQAKVGFMTLSDFEITENQLTNDLLKPESSDDYRTRQANYLQSFLEIQNLSIVYGDFLKTQNSDTAGWADSQDWLKDRQLRDQIALANLVPEEVVNYHDEQGLLSPFYKYGRTLYRKLYEPFYGFAEGKPFSERLSNIKLALAKSQKGATKDRLMSTFDNDFILYLVHNFNFNKDSFMELMIGQNSVAKRVRVAKEKLPNNPFLKALQPLIGEKNKTKIRVDNLRLYEKKLDGYSSNDMVKAFEELHELDSQLYKDIINVLFFQNGLNQGILNFFNVVPQGKDATRTEDNEHLYYAQDIINDSFEQFESLNEQERDLMIDKFLMLFNLNNPNFLASRYNANVVRKKNVTDYQTGQKSIVYVVKGEEKGKEIVVPLLGDRNVKRYHVSGLIVQQPKTLNKQSDENQSQSQSNRLGKLVFSYKGKTIETEFELGVDQSKALRDLIDYVESSNDPAITLQGAAGTGKTSVIGYLQKYFGNRSFLYMAPTHAAVAELAFATVKTGNNKLPLTVAKSVYEKEILGTNKREGFFTSSATKYIGYNSVVVVDESSMLGEKDVRLLVEASKNAGVKLIFMGDSKQIPQVMTGNPSVKNLSPAFTRFKQLSLNQVFRQKNNILLDLLSKMRIQTEFKLFQPRINNDSVQFLPLAEFNKQYVNDLQADPTNTVQISYTNSQVQTINQKAREVLGRVGETQIGDIVIGYLGYGTKQIEKGDVANSIQYKIVKFDKTGSSVGLTIKSDKLDRLSEMGIGGIPPTGYTNYFQLSLNDSLTFNHLTSKDFTNNNNEVSSYFKQIHNLNKNYQNKSISYGVYIEELQSIGAALRKVSVGNTYVFNPSTDQMELFDAVKHKNIKTEGLGSLKFEKDIDYGHAITIHKSQGATIENVYFNADSLSPATNIPIVDQNNVQVTTERQALAYVAMSRSKNKLVVHNTRFEVEKIDSKPLPDTGETTQTEDPIFNLGFTNARQYVQHIADSSDVLSPLATRLLRFKSNVPVMITENVLPNPVKGTDTGRIYGESLAAYFPSTREIKISPKVMFPSRTILHEQIHAITHQYIRDNPNSKEVQELEKLLAYTRSKAMSIDPKAIYPLEDLDEFITGIFTRRNFMLALQQIPYQGSNVMTKLIEWFSKLFQFTPKQNTLFEEVMFHAENLLNQIEREESLGIDLFESLQRETSLEKEYQKILNKYGVKYKGSKEINKNADWPSLLKDIAKVNREFGKSLNLYKAPNDKWYLRISNDVDTISKQQQDNRVVAEYNQKQMETSLGQMGQDVVNNWDRYFDDYLHLSEEDKTAYAQLIENGQVQIQCKL